MQEIFNEVNHYFTENSCEYMCDNGQIAFVGNEGYMIPFECPKCTGEYRRNENV